jgi:hypothetical protein
MIIAVMLFVSICEAGTEKSSTLSKWQNPDIGLTLDGVLDAHDAEGAWKSPGFNLLGG